MVDGDDVFWSERGCEGERVRKEFKVREAIREM
jgi:hypothetical protein